MINFTKEQLIDLMCACSTTGDVWLKKAEKSKSEMDKKTCYKIFNDYMNLHDILSDELDKREAEG